MKNYNVKEINIILTALERYCKVFHTRLSSKSYHTFSNDLEFVKTHLDSFLSSEFLNQLNVSQRLIVFSLIYRVYIKTKETSLFQEIDYFKTLLDSVRTYVLEFDRTSLNNDEIEKLQLCV